MVTEQSDWGGMDAAGHFWRKSDRSFLDFYLRLWQNEKYRIHPNGF
jgi:hypothetical protein